jgi:hypothetical protein
VGPSKLDEIVKDKRVAIIGNATALLSLKLGEEIDSHDVVIRMNRVVDGYLKPDTTGVKTDVIFFARPIFGINRIDYSLAVWTCGEKEFENRHKMAGLEIDRNRLEFFPQDQRMYMKECMFEGCFPTTGFIALHHTMFRDCAECNVFGFDGFRTASIVTGENNSLKWHRPDLESIEINNMIRRNVYLRDLKKQCQNPFTETPIQT